MQLETEVISESVAKCWIPLMSAVEVAKQSCGGGSELPILLVRPDGVIYPTGQFFNYSLLSVAAMA